MDGRAEQKGTFMNNLSWHKERKTIRWCGILLLVIMVNGMSQTTIVYHSFSTGSFRSEGNDAVLTTLLGQSIFGASSANGISVFTGYSAYGKGMITAVTQRPEAVPALFSLQQNYPNPFNPSTTIAFTVQRSGMTTLKVYDILGKEVATLVNDNREAGVYYQARFDASHLASGIYFSRLTNDGRQVMKKMMLIK